VDSEALGNRVSYPFRCAWYRTYDDPVSEPIVLVGTLPYSSVPPNNNTATEK